MKNEMLANINGKHGAAWNDQVKQKEIEITLKDGQKKTVIFVCVFQSNCTSHPPYDTRNTTLE